MKYCTNCGRQLADDEVCTCRQQAQPQTPNQTQDNNAQAVGFCTKLAFNELRMHKVTAVVHPGNVPSMKLLNRLGFVQEGLLHDYLILHGKWCNHYIYGLVNK